MSLWLTNPARECARPSKGTPVLSTAVRVMTGAADLHHVNLGRVLALLAAILAALRSRTAAGLARALLLLLVRHLNLHVLFDSTGPGEFSLSFVPARRRGQARKEVNSKKAKGKSEEGELKSKFLASARPLFCP